MAQTRKISCKKMPNKPKRHSQEKRISALYLTSHQFRMLTLRIKGHYTSLNSILKLQNRAIPSWFVSQNLHLSEYKKSPVSIQWLETNSNKDKAFITTLIASKVTYLPSKDKAMIDCLESRVLTTLGNLNEWFVQNGNIMSKKLIKRKYLQVKCMTVWTIMTVWREIVQKHLFQAYHLTF